MLNKLATKFNSTNSSTFSLLQRSKAQFTSMKRARNQSAQELPEEFQQRHIEPFNKGCKLILDIDPTLYDLIAKKDFSLFLKKEQTPMTLNHHFSKLASSILAQQISGAAANSIKQKVINRFNEFPTFQEMAKLYVDNRSQELRECGLSARKVLYLESLSNYFNENQDSIEKLLTEDSDEIASQLVANIKGIGPWSANMFLVTSMERMDIFAADDLGVARGCSKYLDSHPEILKDIMSKRGPLIKRSKIKHVKKNWKIYDEDIVEKCGELFTPYRSIFMFLMWRLSETNVEVMEKREDEFVEK
ncbi:LANO_0F03884g1_1 [Lachancea nothofagi CBS 11611]|uniref:LANO_0F03884g1_1 n=1 Tax=Lachancea nothofagi CBS 11611 TaxID=1266666 RepID=A0A1G4K7C4_9SACH|nr:LANO_0F03884g1_1 [Lachancea nothofagi CBS 11611]